VVLLTVSAGAAIARSVAEGERYAYNARRGIGSGKHLKSA